MGGWANADPCNCWSCNRECGGTVHPASCGPVELTDGNLICDYCRRQADVFSTPESGRKGLKVEIDQDAIRLDPDVFGGFHGSAHLTEESARHLARELVKAADDLAALNSACWIR